MKQPKPLTKAQEEIQQDLDHAIAARKGLFEKKGKSHRLLMAAGLSAAGVILTYDRIIESLKSQLKK